jgi:molybdate transport system substrate-binding protein
MTGKSALVAFAIGVMSTLGGCDRQQKPPAAATTITVFAAASLREAMTHAERRYEAANPGVDVRTTFGGSGALQRQIERGAQADVFASAADRPMDALEQRGLVDSRSRRKLAGNELVLIVRTSAGGEVRGFDDLGSNRVRWVAMGVPGTVPAGDYADEVLRTLGIRDAVNRKAVLGQDVRAVMASVAAGEADAGIVYHTDGLTAGDRVRMVATAPTGSRPPITYSIAVTTAARNAEAARGFVGFLLGVEGQQLLRARGFIVD